MTATDHPVCARPGCGQPLATSYTTDVVNAQQHHSALAQDGALMVATVLRATSACSWNCLAVLAAIEAGPDADAAVQVVAERERQVTAEGWTPEHDTSHHPGVLARAGIAYAWDHATDPDGDEWRRRHVAPAPDGLRVPYPPDCWPFGTEWWKPKNPERDLVRGAALVAAEADRLVRARRALQRDRF